MPTCPSQADLQAFAVGNLSSAELERIAQHLGHCPRCDGALDTLDAQVDRLVQNLRGLSSSTPAKEAVPAFVVQRAEIAVQSGSPGGRHDVAFDSGRHYARLLKEGPCRLGRFDLLEEIGVGSFGYVFRAHDSELDRIVAVKIQRAGSVASDDEARRFLHEARSAASLSHPSIVSLYDTGQTEDGVCYLVTEYVAGETLEARLRQGRPTYTDSAELVAQLAHALHYAHQHGVVHRDVKPSNVLIDADERPHITDFGLAKRETGEGSLSTEGHVMGTPAYMSPEQARGESRQTGAQSDLYSLGVILYEMLAGERPFQGAKRLLLLQVLEDEPRPPRLLDERIPKDLETICLKAMAKSPARRYATALHLAQDLRRYLDGEPIHARPVGYAERLWRWCRRYPLAASLFLAVSLGSVAGFAYLAGLSAYFVQATALDSARMEADMLADVNEYYSDVLARFDAKQAGVKITHEYAEDRQALPLPATFLIDLGQHISRNESGMHVRLYSQHPFRTDGGPKTEFERTALQACAERRSAQPVDASDDVEYYEFVSVDNRPYLKYARGWIMKESCVKCHNNHRQSPKKDWKTGDLVGVLALTRPLDRDITRTRAGLRGAFILMGAVAVALGMSSLAVALRTRFTTRR